MSEMCSTVLGFSCPCTCARVYSWVAETSIIDGVRKVLGSDFFFETRHYANTIEIKSTLSVISEGLAIIIAHD